MAVAAVVSVVMPLLIIPFAENVVLTSAAIFVWGGMAVAFYSLGLTELGARYSGEALARGNAALVLAYGLGALLSPAAFGTAMDLIPPNGLLWVAAIAAMAYLTLAIIRLRRTPVVSLDSKRETSR